MQIGRRHRIDKTGTDGLHVEGITVFHTETALDVDSRCRERVVRRRGRNQDEIDVVRCQAGIVERCACSLLSERGRGFAFASDITLRDAGALDDPFVGRIDDVFQLTIGHYPFRERCPITANY
ncbi:hypothetical protein D3C73_431020 [compost metagenome]